MTSDQKNTLSTFRDIPFNQLVLTEANARRRVNNSEIEKLAENIKQHGLMQSLNVRPIVDADGKETATFAILDGGRRYRALRILINRGDRRETDQIPCILGTDGLATEISLLANLQRENLHPLELFNNFQKLREQGRSEEQLAKSFGYKLAYVKQLLKLAKVSPTLLEIYGADGMTLEQLQAFTVSDDHAHQVRVWDQLSRTRHCIPHYIKQRLMEGAVPATDKRAIFVGLDAYEAAGGMTIRDLFSEDDGPGGWLQDPALLNRLVAEKLNVKAEELRSEGWKWVQIVTDFSWHETPRGMRRLKSQPVEFTEEEIATRNALNAEYEHLAQQLDGAEDVPEEMNKRLQQIEADLEAFDDRPPTYDPNEMPSAGAFISLNRDGSLRIEGGYVRPEDDSSRAGIQRQAGSTPDRNVSNIEAEAEIADTEGEEDNNLQPLTQQLILELTAYRTLALRDALANDPETAFTAVLHTLCLSVFYQSAGGSCLEISAKSANCTTQAPGLGDSASAQAIDARHKQWVNRLPDTATDLWNVLVTLDRDSQHALFAHCASLSINALHERWNHDPRRLAHADKLADALDLDMAKAGWSATCDNYLGRVPKELIREAVQEAKGHEAAEFLTNMKKKEMAQEAERLLAGTGWLPKLLRRPDPEDTESSADDKLPAFLREEEDHAGANESSDPHISV